MVAKVRGSFSDFTGTLTLDGADPAKSSASLTIVASSLSTNNAERDAHVKSADFLDVEQFPTISFTSKAVTQKDDDEFIVTGDLTIHGVTKSVDVKFELQGTSQDPWGGTRIGFEGKAEISRKEFGLVWNVALETGGVLVSDTIKLEMDVEAVKK
jgi:polyisoprenoid-binding protein YceI